MTKKPGQPDEEPEPAGGKAAERLLDFMQGRFPETGPPGSGEQERPAREAPPGGKAALRLLQLLESAGLARAASELVDRAGGGDRTAFVAAARDVTVAPVPQVSAAEVSETTAAKLADISAEYLSTGQQMATAAPSGRGPWVSLGPLTVPNGQTYGASRVNVSGRVSAVAVDPGNPVHVLACGANGGVWESRDRGTTWAPRTDYAPTTAVGTVVFDSSNPSTVYCGTGEGDWWWWLGAGILRSTDGGTTWSQLCTTPFVGQGFYALMVDGSDSRRLFAAVTSGLYVSTDGGVTWTQRRTPATWAISAGQGTGQVREVLAACRDGLFSSTDAGTTWTGVTLPGSPGTFDRLSVAIAPSNPAVAYAWGARGSTAYLWRRSAGSWTAVTPPSGVSTGQAWYDWFLAVSPDNDSQIYLGAIDAYRGDLSGGTWNWLNMSSKGAGQDSIHPDQHAIAFEPGHPDTIYVGCDGGLFRSDNRGVAWTHCNNGLVISEFEYLAQNNTAQSFILGGTQDNGTLRWTGSGVWDHVADGDGGDCGVNQTTSTTVFSSYIHMALYRSTKSGDFGSWTTITPPVAAGESTPFYPPFECSTTGDTIAIGGARLYVSRDNGSTWTPVAYPSVGTASALYIPNPDNVYVGLTDGRLFAVRWTGTAWGQIEALASPRTGAFISDLYVDPSNLDRIWLTSRTIGGGRVFVSDDGGRQKWLDRTAGLPGLPINAVIADPARADRVWVGADLGVYETLDGGATWHAFSDGLPNAYIGDLLFYPAGRRLRAGTRSRGAWEIQVDGTVSRALASMERVPGEPRVYYFDSAQHVQELRWGGSGWLHADMNVVARGAPAAAPGSPLTVLSIGSGDPRIYYLDPAGHVHEISWWASDWHHRDVTADAGASPSAAGSLTAVGVGANRDPRVYVLDGTLDVHELAWLGRWVDRDITRSASLPQ